MAIYILSLLAIVFSTYGVRKTQKWKVFEPLTDSIFLRVKLDFKMEYSFNHTEQIYTQSDITHFLIYASSSQLWIEISKGVNRDFTLIICKTVDYGSEILLLNCTANIIPPNTDRVKNIRFLHKYKLSKNTKYEFSGHQEYSHSVVKDEDYFNFHLYYLTIEFKDYTNACELNDENFHEIFINSTYLVPCKREARGQAIDVDTREDKETTGTCCCVKSQNSVKPNVGDEQSCEFIFYASGCNSLSSTECFPHLNEDIMKSAECKFCKSNF
ncbi:hypothetical protein RF11_03041 [Thelohanellus kitauei]|uniref:Uncharacterized protein n=1 Tax=Thelohanellus kitauei TaxID=669202 RepID=A0A0C2MNM5_THEKT|nr:hypothetical protein RF11_03041 [Thelohanellus kitauei]